MTQLERLEVRVKDLERITSSLCDELLSLKLDLKPIEEPPLAPAPGREDIYHDFQGLKRVTR